MNSSVKGIKRSGSLVSLPSQLGNQHASKLSMEILNIPLRVKQSDPQLSPLSRLPKHEFSVNMNNLLLDNSNNISSNHDSPSYDVSKINSNKIYEMIYKNPKRSARKQKIDRRLLMRNHSGKATQRHHQITEPSPKKKVLPKSAINRNTIMKKGGFLSVAELILAKNDEFLMPFAKEKLRKKTGQVIKIKRNQKVLDIFSEKDNMDDLIIKNEKSKKSLNLNDYQTKLVIQLYNYSLN